MARFRDPDRWHGCSLELTPETRWAMHTAAWHGFAEDGETDPPGRAPTRAWCAAVYAANRSELVATFGRNRSLLAAWPVATFEEEDGELRRDAEAALADHEVRWRKLAREVAAEENARLAT